MYLIYIAPGEPGTEEHGQEAASDGSDRSFIGAVNYYRDMAWSKTTSRDRRNSS